MGKAQVLVVSCFQQPMASTAKVRRKFVRIMALSMQVQRDLVIHFDFVVSNAKECSSEVDSSKSFLFIMLKSTAIPYIRLLLSL